MDAPPYVCRECNGWGRVPTQVGLRPCVACGGEGKVYEHKRPARARMLF